MQEKQQAPIALKKAHTLHHLNHKRQDPYFWMNQRDSPEVLEYLEAENRYYESQTAHTKAFESQLFEEMKARIKEDDSSVPYKHNGYWYITKFELGKEYPIYTRRKESLEAPEELLFDCNIMAQGHDYFNLGGFSVSPDNRYCVFSTDKVSRRQYVLQIKNLETGEILQDHIENTTESASWAGDSHTFFYTLKNPTTLRSEAIFRHELGQKDPDVEIYKETDETFNTYVFKTKSKKYIVIGSSSTLTTEYQIFPADTPLARPKIFSKRERGLEYDLNHYEDHFYILTNKDGATNFKVMRAHETKTEQSHWEEFIPHRPEVLVEDISIFKDFYVLSERSHGLPRIFIQPWDANTAAHYLPFDSETYTAYVGTNPEFDTHLLRFGYNSLSTPASVYDYNVQTREKILLKQQEVLDPSFNERDYISKRIWATAEDGIQVPISLVYHKDTPVDGSSPLLQYGYGSYGHTSDPYFSTVRLSLLQRGFVYAIAHIRGGEYLGRPWYESGKLLEKRNTFTDFIACSKHLIAQGYAAKDGLFAYGGSAGGLLMGAVMNMAPELYKGVIASVPFVDVVTTMLDESIPLTTGEYDEWGNPNEKEFYEYMLSYSPYDNVVAQDYPNTLVITGYHDSQVQYWEPAKWVAKLRDLKTDHNRLLFHTNMEAGHSGASGRFESLKEIAKEYAFIIDLSDKSLE
jgi:oligopeptidase B